MRIDSFASFPLDRPARPGSAVTPYRESQRSADEARQARDQQRSEATSQGLERQPQRRQVEPSIEVIGSRWQRGDEARQAEFIPPANSYVARALSSYLSTAQFQEFTAEQVLGLDLYA